ncbi:lipoprotein insertase outer membrane protein LolB [Lysobacter sp. F6437]|uniref:lipoprotein insertase outer membrane protein LolB n=1 Tax=Lysobacter sp. F6437 TaxID=3459296 RepID=UPI00403D77BD
MTLSNFRGSTFAIAALALLLGACTPAPVRPDLTAAQIAVAEAAQVQREQDLRMRRDWSLVGRIAVSNRGKGGSGRIEWSQHGAQYEVALSAPVTRQGWRLSGDAGHALLEGLEGGPRTGPDARLLLLEATGWDIPVQALAEWIRGARARSLGPARIQYDANGLPWSIEQGGWLIEYQWPQPDPATPAGTTPLPARLDATRGEASVKLLVDEWGGA